jgi:predicted nucleic acid-binding protein
MFPLIYLPGQRILVGYGNVLALYIRKKNIRLEEAQRIMEEALHLMREREYEVTSCQGLNLVATSTCSAYDCEFVASAKDSNVPLVAVNPRILIQSTGIAGTLAKFLAA